MSENLKYKMTVEIRSSSILDLKKGLEEAKTGLNLGKELFSSKRLSYHIDFINEEIIDTVNHRIEVINGKTYIVIPSKL